MGLNEAKGNMYPFVTHTWNTVKGKCSHDCAYCYMKKWGKQSSLHFDESELKTDLGEGNFIFVGSSCDMWAHDILEEWIDKTLGHCEEYPFNDYLFQSKYPVRFNEYKTAFPLSAILGTTIETNRFHPEYMGKTIKPEDRMMSLCCSGLKLMVTIEPIMDFDLDEFVRIIEFIQPKWVNIGANTASWVKLPEPEPSKIKNLISALEEFTEVKIKKNLNRLLK